MRRSWRARAARAAGGLAVGSAGLIGLSCLAGAGVYLWLRTDAGQEWLRSMVESQISGLMTEGSASIGGLRTDLWSRIDLDDVALIDGSGRPVVRSGEIRARIDLFRLLRWRVGVSSLTVDGLIVDLRSDDAGAYDIARMFTSGAPPSTEPWAGLPIGIAVDGIDVSAPEVLIQIGRDDVLLRGVDLTGRFLGVGKRIEVGDLVLTGSARAPEHGGLALTANAVWDDRGLSMLDADVALLRSKLRVMGRAPDLFDEASEVDVRLDIDKLDLADVDAWVQAGLTGVVEGRILAGGTVGAVAIEGHLVGLDETEVEVGVRGTANVVAPSVDAEVVLTRFRVDHVVPAVSIPLAVPGVLTVRARAGGGEAEWVGSATEIFDVFIERTAVTARLDGNTLQLVDIAAEGPVGAVRGAGTFDLHSGAANATMDILRAEPGVLTKLGVPPEIRGTKLTGSIEAEASLYAEGIPASARTLLVFSPVRWGPEVWVDRVDAVLGVRHLANHLTVDGEVRARRVDAYGARVGEVALTELAFHLDDQTVTVNGRIEGTDVMFEAVPEALRADLGSGFSAARLYGALEVRVPVADPASLWASAHLDLEDHRTLRFSGPGGRLTAVVDGRTVAVDLALLGDDHGVLVDTSVAIDLDERRLVIGNLDLDAGPTQRWEARQGSEVSWSVDGRSVFADVGLISRRGRVRVVGGLEDGDPELSFDLYDLDLALVSEWLPTTVPGLSGILGAALTVGGTATAVTVEGEIEGSDLAWLAFDEDGSSSPVIHDVGFRTVVGSSPQGLTVRGRMTGLNTPLVDFDASLPMIMDLSALALDPEGPIALDITVLPGRLARLEAVLSGIDLPQGVVSGRLVGSGTLRHPVLDLRSVMELPVAGLEGPGRVETFVTITDRDVTWEVDLREGLQGVVEVRGGGRTRLGSVLRSVVDADAPVVDLSDLDVWLTGLYGGVTLRSLPIHRAIALFKLPIDADGSLSGHVAFAGSLAQPRPAARLVLEGGRLGGVDLTSAEFDLESGETGMTVGLDVEMRERETGRSGEIYLDGVLPLVVDLRQDPYDWVTEGLEVRAMAEIPLAVLSAFDEGIRNPAGKLILYGTVEGDPLDPTPIVSVSLTHGSAIGYEPLGIRADDLSLYAGFDRDGVTLTRLQARTSFLDPRASRTGLLGSLGRSVNKLFARRRDDPGDGGRGTVTALGTASLDRWVLTDLDLQASLDRALLLGTRDQTLRLSTAPDRPLRVGGDTTFPLVTGAVRVDEADVFLDYAAAVGGGPTKVDPRIRVNRGERVQVTPPPETSVLDDVSVEVDLDLGRSTRGQLSMPIESMGFLGQAASTLSRMDLRARLGGQVRFRQIPCRRPGDDGMPVEVPGLRGSCGLFHPRMEGNVEVVDGLARILRAEFDLRDSRVSFFGGDVSDPALDIKGRMTTGDVTIDLTVTGTALEPDVQFGSADSDQIFATLLLGTSPDNLGTHGASQLAFAAAMTAFQSVLSSANMGSFSIQPNGQIVWGLAVARDLYVEGTLGGTPRPDQNTLEVQVEYSIIQNVIGRVGFGAYAIPFWMDLLVERRFD